MGFVIVYGADGGDEGKGAVVDRLAEYSLAGGRYNGGPNAGHTVKVDETTIKLHQFPSTIVRANEGVISAIGSGMVVDPWKLADRISELREEYGLEINPETFWIDPRAHVILPHYIEIDRSYGQKIGTTGSGVGPAYAAKHARDGIRFEDFNFPDTLWDKIRENVEARIPMLLKAGLSNSEIKQRLEKMKKEISEFYDPSNPRNLTQYFRNVPKEFKAIVNDMKETVIAEGAQGMLIDIDYGTYPDVTSSIVGPAGAIQSFNIYRNQIDEVIAVLKAYSTRVGGGILVTEIHDERAVYLQEKGGEIGTTTGRKRRCGWIDLVRLRYTTRQADYLYLTKLDVLEGIPGGKVYACIAYKMPDGSSIEEYEPLSNEALQGAHPVLEEFDAWDKTVKDGELTKNARIFVEFILDQLGKRLMAVGVGPEREQAIELYW
jgi:adenylosuccinate synthase